MGMQPRSSHARIPFTNNRSQPRNASYLQRLYTDRTVQHQHDSSWSGTARARYRLRLGKAHGKSLDALEHRRFVFAIHNHVIDRNLLTLEKLIP
jgi:hypothetical protein